MTTGGNYVHKPVVNLCGGYLENINFMQLSQNIDDFRQNDSQGF